MPASVWKAVMNTSGIANYNFTAAPAGSYWIFVKHRNSITTASAAPVAVPGSYDFSISSAQAFAANMIEPAADGVWCFFTGDLNQDGFIDIFDFPDYDLDNQNFVAFEYKATDMNGDGFVDIFDFPYYDLNNQNFVFSITP